MVAKFYLNQLSSVKKLLGLISTGNFALFDKFRKHATDASYLEGKKR
jgi:hypothetical protein